MNGQRSALYIYISYLGEQQTKIIVIKKFKYPTYLDKENNKRIIVLQAYMIASALADRKACNNLTSPVPF
jgi:hypothetical protein